MNAQAVASFVRSRDDVLPRRTIVVLAGVVLLSATMLPAIETTAKPSRRARRRARRRQRRECKNQPRAAASTGSDCDTDEDDGSGSGDGAGSSPL
jgi:hypothetical protein